MEMIRKEAGFQNMRLLKVRILFQHAGLASSQVHMRISGACNEALQLGLSDKDLSRLARRGSGSIS